MRFPQWSPQTHWIHCRKRQLVVIPVRVSKSEMGELLCFRVEQRGKKGSLEVNPPRNGGSAYILSSAATAADAFLSVRATKAHIRALVESLTCATIPQALEGPLFLNAIADFLLEFTHLLL